MDRLIVLLAAVIAASGLVSGEVLADGTPGHATAGYGVGPRGDEGGEGKWLARLDELKLTPEQRQAIEQIAERYRVLGTDAAQRASGIREQWLNVSPDDPGYAQATDKASEAAARLAADAVRLLGAMRAEVDAVLSDEQRQLLKDRMTGERARWDDWRARHQPPQ